MVVFNIAIILNKKLIKKWFVIKNVTTTLREEINELMEDYYTIVNSYDDELNFIKFIKLNGVDAFFDKMKKDYSLEEVSLRDLVDNYSPNDLKECYDIILDVDEDKNAFREEDISEIYYEYSDGDIDLKTAINEYKKMGIEVPIFSSTKFNPKDKVYAIDVSMDLDCEYHSYFMLFNSREDALLMKKFFKKGSIGECIFRYNTLSCFLNEIYEETTCSVHHLPNYKGRITFLVGPVYLGEDEC